MKEQILKATGDELSRLAGEVLQPEKNEHRWPMHNTTICLKCDQRLRIFSTIYAGDIDTEAKKLPCPVPDPIPLTWAEAMKWRDWAEEHDFYGLDKQLEAVYRFCRDGSFEPWGRWFTLFAQPEHYIKAACLCKLGSEEAE
jgi:hypothetical protein